ncbi:Claudin-10 [Acipenser ruthenus]|uniref:Claudin n=1 Tax=Acipenser ruthenus TaxID=7906 RepID=A0A662YZC2_ACIRT|nr:Claudin-10 [Acipenser ruthenus]
MSNMGVEMLAFTLAVSGWILISSTIPTDYWKVSSIDGTVITTATFWSNLWKTCVTDSTGVSNCKDFPSMLALEGYIQVCRGLMIAAVCLGFFGSILALVGMKCTKIGGSDKTKARIACLAGIHFILGGKYCPCIVYNSLFFHAFGETLKLLFIFTGLSSVTACSLYAHRITSEFFDPTYIAQKAGYTYSGAASFISSRTKVQNTAADVRSARGNGNPPKHFDKNAYV